MNSLTPNAYTLQERRCRKVFSKAGNTPFIGRLRPLLLTHAEFIHRHAKIVSMMNELSSKRKWNKKTKLEVEERLIKPYFIALVKNVFLTQNLNYSIPCSLFLAHSTTDWHP